MKRLIIVPLVLAAFLCWFSTGCDPVDPDIQYTITVSASPTEGGTVSGGGSYNKGAAVTLTASPNTGYNFQNWTEGTTSVNSHSTYIFIATSDRTLSANFQRSTDPDPGDQITDPRDGQTYSVVTIGTQVWMAENLNFQTGNSWCYADNPANCLIYGRLYDWETALTACPPDWRLPGDAEWTVLTDFLGGSEIAGGKMKTTGSFEEGYDEEENSGFWSYPNTGATNESGWSGLPGGFRSQDGMFGLLGLDGIWWSSTEWRISELDINNAWSRSLHYDDSNVFRDSSGGKDSGFSVRCIRN